VRERSLKKADWEHARSWLLIGWFVHPMIVPFALSLYARERKECVDVVVHRMGKSMWVSVDKSCRIDEVEACSDVVQRMML
jgi:hypothetical protein